MITKHSPGSMVGSVTANGRHQVTVTWNSLLCVCVLIALKGDALLSTFMFGGPSPPKMLF